MLSITFETCEENAKLFLEILDPHCLSLSFFEDPKNPEKWTLEGLLEEKDLASFKEALSHLTHVHNFASPSLTICSVPQKNWVLETYKAFPPLEIGCFFVHGTHTSTPCPKDFISLKIDAATAFGSGEHATTKGCLLLLETLWNEHRMDLFSSPRFLDVGTGSGILAFAMAKLFKTQVQALDNDPEAIRVTQENAHLNHVSDLIEAHVSNGFEIFKQKPQAPFALIMANILKGPLITMAPDMAHYTCDAGFCILSGLLTAQLPEILEVYQKEKFALLRTFEEGEWSAILLQKQGSSVCQDA